MKATVQVRVNGQDRSVEVDTRTIVADMLREQLRLTSVHIQRCAIGNCGACTDLLDGRTVTSCCLLAAMSMGMRSSPSRESRPALTSFTPSRNASSRTSCCSACTVPAMILSALALLTENLRPTEEEIRHGIAGNLCRCTGYHFIVTSIQAAAERMAQNATQALSGTGT